MTICCIAHLTDVVPMFLRFSRLHTQADTDLSASKRESARGPGSLPSETGHSC